MQVTAEYSLLRCWDFIQKNKLTQNKKVLASFTRVTGIYFHFGAAYISKVGDYCYVKDGVTKLCTNSTTASQVAFEQIGILASSGLAQFFFGLSHDEPKAIENAKKIGLALKALIENHGISGSPVFDEMTIDICLGILLLVLIDERECAKEWIFSLVHRFNFSYVILEKRFPICQDSLEHLLAFEADDDASKSEMASISTLLPTLAYWCAILDNPETYERLIKFVEGELKDCCLQIWYPAAGIKNTIFSRYAGNDAGIAEAPIYLPKTLDQLKDRLVLLLETAKKNEKFETVWNDCPAALPLIASRHFRTPVVPFYWLSLLPLKNTENEADVPRNT